MEKVTPIILAGGSGTRLWPISRKSYPKQFSGMFGDNSLFQQTTLRLLSNDLVNFSNQIIVTNSDFRFIVSDQLKQISVDVGQIIIEPISKNTGPAILAASLFAFNKNPNAVLLVAPSDHIIKNVANFHEAVQLGLSEVKKSNIVTFGVLPTSAETGYGYLELVGIPDAKSIALKSFVEKPDLSSAQKMLKSKRYLWNSGIFMFRAIDILNAFEMYLPDMLNPVQMALAQGEYDLDFFRLNSDEWSKCGNISIDFAVMEKARNLVAIPLDAGWSDLGDWGSVIKYQSTKDKSLEKIYNVTELECDNVFLKSENKEQHLVGIGLENIAAIATKDAVLVVQKDRVQDVKTVVEILKKNDVLQAENFLKDFRPWGFFEVLADSDFCKVKRLVINPKSALSLQSHKFRSEHWVVVKGEANVTVDDEIRLLKEGESVYVPLGAIHRLENLTDIPLVIVEVQTGTYFGEDDIQRYDDSYFRHLE